MRGRALLIWVTVVSPHPEMYLTHIRHPMKSLLNERFSLILHSDMSPATLPTTAISTVVRDS